MDKDAYAKKLITVLNSSLDGLRPEVTNKLQAAREQACVLAAQQTQTHRFNFAHSLVLSDWMRNHRTGLTGMVLATVLLCASVAVWHTSYSTEDDTIDIDTALLTGDLPVNAYLDGHLSKWVNNSSD